MTEKNTAVQQATPKKETLTDISADAERTRLLARLHTGAPATVTALALSIPMPAASVKALHIQVPALKTPRIKLTDNHRRPRHGVASQYFGAQADSNIAARNERNAVQPGV
ncbi:hypothetical protein H8F22_15210 [Pseudomonas sp. P154a]|uniref:hypothetical protein n=1 Tax=Pseudomonas mucoides TaxID=2730424 RepID=UPI0018923FC1|nr:hypothetical protein [Pseudomonas mucoides]MBF6040223.1 hypothetical protein [Pseudomonas mucoides]